MFITGSLIVLMGGYLLWIYAAKQKGFKQTFGVFLAWLVMIVSLAGTTCGVVKRVQGKCYTKERCPYSHPYHHKHSHEKESPAPEEKQE